MKEKILANTYFNENMYNGRNTCEIFSDFGHTFDNMLIVSFLPFLEPALENTVEILQADNV